jgi:hypothetical protein
MAGLIALLKNTPYVFNPGNVKFGLEHLDLTLGWDN